MLQTVIETPAFLSQAGKEGMTEEERRDAVLTVAADPKAGERIVGSGGCRKIRIAGRGKGKSGGYRVVSWFGGVHAPAFLLAVLSKGSRENFNRAEIKAMASTSRRLIASLGPKAIG